MIKTIRFLSTMIALLIVGIMSQSIIPGVAYSDGVCPSGVSKGQSPFQYVALPDGQLVTQLFDSPQNMVANSNGFSVVRVTDTYWEGTINDPDNAWVLFNPVRFMPEEARSLYISMSLDAPAFLKMEFSPYPEGPFSFMHLFQSLTKLGTTSPIAYGFDTTTFPSMSMSNYHEFNFTVQGMRFSWPQAKKGSILKIYGLGISSKVPIESQSTNFQPTSIVTLPINKNVRMAAWHESVVETDEIVGNTALMTYVNDKFSYMDYYNLARIAPALKIGNELIPLNKGKDLRVEDFPGGVEGKLDVSGVKVTTKVRPLAVGRDTFQIQEGAAIYSIETDPPTPLTLFVDTGVMMHSMSIVNILQQNILDAPTTDTKRDIEILGQTALIKRPDTPFVIGFKGIQSTPVLATTGSAYLEFSFESGKGELLLVFAPERDMAVEIASLDAESLKTELNAEYAKLMACRIETPDTILNEGFRTAIYNLEYNWLKPWGWNECIHHWLALWHMQHTAAAEWIGQTDRSRICTETTGENLLPNGAIPQFLPSGFKRRDFGGSNQFWAWQVRHYLKFTNDIGFAERMAPVLDTVIAQTLEEHDHENDLLLQWGLQIGNQEDYIATPGNGVAASIEGINMMKTRVELAKALNDEPTAHRYQVMVDKATANLKDQLWIPQLGRYGFFRDSLGVLRLEGPYQSFIYPAIWDLADPLDAWTGMRQIYDTLTGPEGDVYLSNHFSSHIAGTWGMQSGEAQQPWAAWGHAATGQYNKTWKPLHAAAAWAMDPNHRGSWPEVASESTPAYFSPPAGLFIASTVEALFGLKVDKPAGILKVSPSFPDEWPNAKLELPEYQATYTKIDSTYTYNVVSATPLMREVKWALPPSRIESVQCNGQEVRYEVISGVDCIYISFTTEQEASSTITIRAFPYNYQSAKSKIIAEGSAIQESLYGVKIINIIDRSSLLVSSKLIENGFEAQLRDDLLKDFDHYGQLGQMIFSRRTFFVEAETPQKYRFYIPINLTIVPKIEVAPVGELELVDNFGAPSILAKIRIRNHIWFNASTITLIAAHGEWPVKINDYSVDLKQVAPNDRIYTALIPSDRLALFSPGDNQAEIIFSLSPTPIRVPITLTASKIYETNDALKESARTRMHAIPLEGELLEDTDWLSVRIWGQYTHMPWAGAKPPLEAFADKPKVTLPELPQVEFTLDGRKFMPVSRYMGRSSINIDLGLKSYKKIYLLVIPFLDNHDMFAPVARVSVMTKEAKHFSKDLYFPGDFDLWNSEEGVGMFASARTSRTDRFGLLSLKANAQTPTPWQALTQPNYPQPEYFSRSLALKSPSSIMNVIELDLPKLTVLKHLTFESLGTDPGFGIVAIVGESAGGHKVLKGTQWEPNSKFREPIMLYDFTGGDLTGWTIEGGFSVNTSSLFSVPTLNSVSTQGEQATGLALSPVFEVEENTVLCAEIQGGRSDTVNDQPNLALQVIDANSGEVLRTLLPPGTHTIQELRSDLTGLAHRPLRLRLIDENQNTSYAWIGIRSILLRAQ